MPEYRLTVNKVGDLPYLLLGEVGLSADAPLVLVLHGIGGRKEKILPTLYAFAQEGFRVAALDVRLHGDRRFAEERERRLADAYLLTMYDLVTGTAQDVGALLDHLGADRAGIHGISLGGIITFSALISEPRLAVASVAMGTPDWLGPLRAMGINLAHPAMAPVVAANPIDYAQFSYPPRPLLMLHGLKDDVVSVEGVQMLAERIGPAYADTPGHVELVVFPDLGHQYTDEMTQRSVAWTKRFL